MKKTKIICTMGPRTMDKIILKELIAGGMNVARFNFSHGSYEEHAERRFVPGFSKTARKYLWSRERNLHCIQKSEKAMKQDVPSPISSLSTM